MNELLSHTAAVRRNKDILGHVFLFLAEHPPNASAAKEAFDELDFKDQVELWLSTTAGGIWERWERDAIRYGRLDETTAYAIWQRRSIPEAFV
ncbi:MAG: hypothetical protein ACXAEN_25625 [Candidatus Thorarchaeota archaeon]|jgi:hypothetical protein